MSRKQIISLGAVAVVLVSVMGMSAVSFAASESRDEGATKDHPRFNSEEWQERKAEMEVKREEVMTAVEAGDYQAWLEAVGSDRPMAQEVTEDEFPRLIEAHNLMREGKEKFDQARIIKEEIGLSFGQGKKGEFRKGLGQRMMRPGMGFRK